MSALTRIATYRLSARTILCIAQGSVVDFSWDNPKSAIVNAANEGCLGGGGVDGAITTAGGPNLAKDRKALPTHMGVRCFTGDAKLTGPGKYGSLEVPYVIHAVGPNYNDCSSLKKGDDLLRSAYHASLERAQEAELEAAAFALLSAGTYRGRQSVRNVLHIAVTTIKEWAQKDNSLKHVFLCGFSANEVETLMDICNDLNLKNVPDDEL
jgi:O-acetyl-ADP-ribose deacetylase (regulator of RNase III)